MTRIQYEHKREQMAALRRDFVKLWNEKHGAPRTEVEVMKMHHAWNFHRNTARATTQEVGV